MAGVPHGGNMWKNIAIGILTTVVAYLIVNFVKDKKESKKIQKEKSEANRSAWESVNSYLLNATKKFESIACFSCDYSKMKNELIRELEENCNSLRNIKGNQYVDEKMKTIIDRTISRFNSLKPLFLNFFDSINIIISKNLPESERVTRSKNIYKEFNDSKVRIDTVDYQEIIRLLADINSKYKLSLEREEIEEKLSFSNLPGKWKIECLVVVEFKPDGKMTWTEGENTFVGTWLRIDEKLNINLNTDQQFEFIIKKLNDSFMKLEVEDSPVLYGACRM